MAKTGFPRFKVEVPFGRFSRRIILSPKDLKRRQGIVCNLNRRLVSHEDAKRLEKEGVIYSAEEAKGPGVLPENITYHRLFGSQRPLLVDPPRPRNAAEYFIEFLHTRKIDAAMIEKAPALAAFLDAIQTYEWKAEDTNLAAAEDLAKGGASETALCAALFWHNINPLSDKSASGYITIKRANPFFQDVVSCGVRLGIRRKVLLSGIAEVQAVVEQVFRAERAGISLMGFPGSKIKIDREQIINHVNMIRSILGSREARSLYAASSLYHLSRFAEKRLAEAKESRKWGKGIPPLERDGELLKLQYFLQVLPVVEELNVSYLTAKIKDAYFKAFEPLDHLMIQEWFESLMALDREAAEKHVANVARLIREVGRATGLLPEGASVSGRVKTTYSIREKLLRHYGEASEKLLIELHDIFGVRILLSRLSEVEKVAHLLRQTFLKVPDAVGERRAESYRVTESDGEVIKRLRRFNYLERFENFAGRKLDKRGYIDGEKNTIFRSSLSGEKKVRYHFMVRTTYLYLPMEFQIATFRLEKENEAKNPHWEYKFLIQLRIQGMGDGIEQGDFEKGKGTYVMLRDMGSGEVRVEFLPEGSKRRPVFPGYDVVDPENKIYWEQTAPGSGSWKLETHQIYSGNFGAPEMDPAGGPLQNGDILEKK